MSHNLKELAKKISNDICGVTSNSKEVKKNFAFVAIKGSIVDGHNYIKDSLDNGASYVICDQPSLIQDERIIKVPCSRKFLSFLSSAFYKHQPENIVAVTGTNGKTSTVAFFKQIIESDNKSVATLGTIGLQGMSGITDFLTTPEVTKIFKILRDASLIGVNYFALEASSHGLHQNRLDGINFKAVAFTNFSKDHLDYHLNMHEYLEAKKYLFSNLAKEGTVAVLNADIPEYKELKDLCLSKKLYVFSYGFNGDDFKFIKVTPQKSKIDFTFLYKNKIFNQCLNIVGEFQVYNIMCAAGLAIACGINYQNIFASFSNLFSVAGRMEKIEYEGLGEIYIDYSHTPDALLKALTSLKPYCQNRLLVVFGCGGDRDPSKRSEMGIIAVKQSNYCIITDDNPRTEDPAKIRNDITKQLEPGSYIEIYPREDAINFALKSMQKGDILLIAGKGHETYQIIGNTKYDFNEIKIVKDYIKNNPFYS